MDVSDIFYFLLRSGRGKGESEAPGGELKIPGGRSPGLGRAEGPGGCLRRIGQLEGGANFFFFGAETSTKYTIGREKGIHHRGLGQ